MTDKSHFIHAGAKGAVKERARVCSCVACPGRQSFEFDIVRVVKISKATYILARQADEEIANAGNPVGDGRVPARHQRINRRFAGIGSARVMPHVVIKRYIIDVAGWL